MHINSFNNNKYSAMAYFFACIINVWNVIKIHEALTVIYYCVRKKNYFVSLDLQHTFIYNKFLHSCIN